MCLLLLNLQMDIIKYAFDKFADGDGEISIERLAEVLEEQDRFHALCVSRPGK